MSSDPDAVNQNKADRSRRLIEEWLPIAALGEESIRERRSMTALPPTYYLHVWWARRPLVASRAAILGALLPAGADREKFMHVLGIHGDPVATRRQIDEAERNINQKTGKRENLGADPYGYKRAFTYQPTRADLSWLHADGERPLVLDCTAGGGSIPFEAIRVGCQTIANDLNPIAWLILKATVEFPALFGSDLLQRYQELGKRFIERATPKFEGIFPHESKGVTVDGYIWARTIRCPYCNGTVPLSPNWRLSGDGTGVRLLPDTNDPANRHVHFEIVSTTKEQSAGTVSGGDARCPFPDCDRVIEGDEIKAQAQAGKMGEQLYAVVYKEEKIVGHTKTGKSKTKSVRGFRVPRPDDDATAKVLAALEGKMPEWLARGIVPYEERYIGPADRSANYGMLRMTDLFSPRQLYGHCVSVEVFQEIVEECGGIYEIGELDKAAFTYIAIALDKMLNYNARMVRWHANREVVAGVFDRHDFSFKWSYAEMAPTITGLGYDWAIEQTGKSLMELIDLLGRNAPVPIKGQLKTIVPKYSPPQFTVTCQSADSLSHIESGSMDAVIMDPPYYDNVMYAELSDFFYVWLKRTAGLFYPEQFSNYLTDKDREAIANPAKFKGVAEGKVNGGVRKLAGRDYQERMQAIFAECRRVLRPEGIMVLMFTHKASGAWDALAKGLIDAGFVITASWPINTEAEGSLHIKDKNAAKSTIFLVCRPRESTSEDSVITYWEDVEPKVARIVKERVQTFQDSGIGGVDLYLACFGPALEVFSTYWPMQRGRAAQKPEPAKGTQLKLMEDDEWDPYAVRPEEALMAARTAVKEWRLSQLSSVKRHAHLDPITEFFVLAWDAFRAPQFPADESLKLARVVGISFDQQLRGKILEVKGEDVILWDSSIRAQKGSIGSLEGKSMLDALHKAARMGREQNTGVAKDFLERANLNKDPAFMLALEALLNVLPPPQYSPDTKNGPLNGAAADCNALEKLRQLTFPTEIPPPLRQLPIGAVVSGVKTP